MLKKLSALVALCLALVSPPVSAAPASIALFGDSTMQNGTVNVPQSALYPFTSAPQYAIGSQSSSIIGWLVAFSNGGFQTDYNAYGYPGSVNGIRNVTILTPGQCTPNSNLTFTPGAPNSTPANQAAAISVHFDASGYATVGQRIYLSDTGSGYTSPPTFTVSGNGQCATLPTFGYTLTGTGTFGVAGDTLDNMIWRAQQDVCPAHPDIVVFSGGTNSVVRGDSEATITAQIQQIVTILQGCNSRVVLEGIQPRTNGVGGWTTTMEKIRQRVNAFEQSICQAARTMSAKPHVVCADVSKYWSNPADANGSVLTAMVADGVHGGPGGNQTRALVIFDAISNWSNPGQFFPNNQQDVYDATNYPNGSILGTPGLFLGTGGTLGGPCTGTLAASWNVDTSTTGTLTCTASIESTRTDGKPGQRQVLALSTTGGGTTERVRLFANISASNVAKGTDSLTGQIYLDLSNLSNIQYIGCQLFENVSAGNNQGSLGVFSGTYGSTYPLLSSAQLAKMQEAKALPDFGLTAAGSFMLPCTMPPVQTQASATGYILYVYIYATGTWTATVKAGPARVVKNVL